MPMTDRKLEARWVLLAQTGDVAAFDRLLRSVQDPLYRYLLRLVGDRATAEDVLQEVFLLIYLKLQWLREPELFRPWAYRVATRQGFKVLRRERRWRRPDDSALALESIPAPEPPKAELLARLPELVAQVSPASRAVLVLHYLHELPLDEVADVIGIPLGTAKSRLAYGLAALRQIVGNREPT